MPEAVSRLRQPVSCAEPQCFFWKLIFVSLSAAMVFPIVVGDRDERKKEMADGWFLVWANKTSTLARAITIFPSLAM